MNREKTIGILGGMGPEATASFFKKIITHTEVNSDQDHYRVIIDSNPKIPDRTAFILGGGESPLPEIQHTAQNLSQTGADLIAIPCMTAHYFRKEIQDSVDIPVLNAYEILEDYLSENYPHLTKVGVLSTTGTRKTQLFEKNLPAYDIVILDDEKQEVYVMEAIYGKKGIKNGFSEGKAKDLLIAAANELIQQGAEMIIAGCTEVGLSLKDEDISVPLIDPMETMAIFLTQE